jgi:GT2 family glycosyltransferase
MMQQPVVRLDTSENLGHEHRLPRVSVIIVNFNGQDYLENCLVSLQQQTYPDYEIILVDNASSDRSIEIAQQYADDVKLVISGHNLGFAGGNNLGVQHTTGDYLAFLNPDTIVQPAWLIELVNAMTTIDRAGLATAKILLLSEPDRINTCGNDVHFTGIPTVRGWRLPASSMDQIEEVCSVSGACFLMRKQVFVEIGGFSDDFFLYCEDNDLAWRAQLAGYSCWYVPTSVVFHRYAPRFGADKFYFLERNRYRVVLQNLRWKTIVLLFPALALSDIITWGYALLQGRKHAVAKLRVYGWFLTHWKTVAAARREVARFRRAPDRELLERCSSRLSYGLAANESAISRIASRIFDPIFFGLYRVCLAIIHW